MGGNEKIPFQKSLILLKVINLLFIIYGNDLFLIDKDLIRVTFQCIKKLISVLIYFY